MERTRNGPLPLVLPALVVLPVAGLAILASVWRWHETDVRASLVRRLADSAAAVERQLDASVQQQSDATRVLATSPAVWLWVKFQGERLTVSNRSHAQAALEEITSFSGLVPGMTVYLASERTRTVYQSGAAVAVLSPSDTRDAWYPAGLASEGVVVSDDPRQVRTSMRVMNGKELIGAVSCATDLPRLAAAALSAADDERGFSYVLADRQGALLLSRGPEKPSAATVFEMIDASERPRLRAALDVVARPAGMTVDAFSSHGRRMLTAISRTGPPGWYVLVSSEMTGMPAGRVAAVAGFLAAALVLVGGALLLIGLRRARQADILATGLSRQRDEAEAHARESEAEATRLKESAVRVRERARGLAAETAAGSQAVADTAREVHLAEEASAELRAGIGARMALFSQLADSVRKAADDMGQARSGGREAGQRSAAVEEKLNRVITSSTAVSLALEEAAKAAEGAMERAERARILALNSALEASRPGSPRRTGAAAAEEMRRLAEGAEEGARSLREALARAREALLTVNQAAQESGVGAHEAAAAGAQIEAFLQAATEAIEQARVRLDAARASAASFPTVQTEADRARSSAAGAARILERVTALCGELSSLAEEMSEEETSAESREQRGASEPRSRTATGA